MTQQTMLKVTGLKVGGTSPPVGIGRTERRMRPPAPTATRKRSVAFTPA